VKLKIHQIILEAVKFKHRDDYLALLPTTSLPSTDIQLAAGLAVSDSNPNDMLVRLEARSGDGGLTSFDVSYVMLIGVEYDAEEVPPPDLPNRILVTGATMLLPFVREVVANLTAKGRFGPTWLAPTNFHKAFAESDATTATTITSQP